jgi:hypothetical protein
MQKILASLFALLLTSAVQTAFGEQDGEWTYSVLNGQATISGYTGLGGAVTVPSHVNELPVVKVDGYGSPLFGWNNNSVTSVVIPNSVTSIGERAFSSCNSLISVTIPNSVTSISNWTFMGCGNLTSVTIPNSVTSIGESAFAGIGITSITIPNSVTSIGRYAFAWCSSLTSVTIPNSVTSIGESAFQQCSSLTSVTIPNSVTSIGNYAFQECSSLTSVTIPNSVTSIGDDAFQQCSSLTSVTIPNSVTSIGDGAFNYCTNLASITIPSSVISIGSNALFGCTSLISVTMPDRFIAQVSQIGVSGQVATDYLVNALANNDAFVTAVANKIKATGGNYGIATQSGLSSAITTAVEPLATKSELTSSLTQSRTDGVNSVLSNPNLWTLYTTSQIQNMAVGDLLLSRQVGGGFILNYDIEQSTDLQTWTPYQALSLPLNGLPTDKAFVRIKAKQ